MVRLRLAHRLGLLTPLLRFHRWANEPPPLEDPAPEPSHRPHTQAP
jgi:hypothetical protein